MGRRGVMVSLLAAACFLFATVLLPLTVFGSPPADFDWRSDWAVQRGFNITIDTQGFRFPTAIAFVPDPGNSPKDPLYFVTELKGTIKVVTNDRSVFTFAEDFFQLRPKRVMPAIDEEIGLAGICLDGQRGYVFATFAYHDSENILRNNIVRFDSQPGIFSLTPTSQVEFTEVLAPYQSIASHQIGPCQVADERLYVSVADGAQTTRSQQLDSLLGKIVRMTLDGRPAPDNPFYQDDDPGNPTNYVWASGLRNPFGLKIVGSRVFVADNGPDVDRFLQVKAGGNYLWDGTNLSIGTNADAVFSPGRGVAQLDFYPQGANLFPSRFENSFLMTVSGNPARRREGVPAIWTVPYDLEQEKLPSVPSPMLRYRGNQIQVVAGLALGPDGLYFAPLLPNQEGLSPVLKVTYEPEADYPYTLAAESNPLALMTTRGCFACHTLNNNAGGTVGPILDRNVLVPKLQERLSSEVYGLAVEQVDQLNQEPFVSFQEARHAVQRAQGLEKVQLWLEYRLQEPRFDDPSAQMPNLGLTREEAEIIASYLSGIQGEAPKGPGVLRRIFSRTTDMVQNRLPIPTRANAKTFLAGFFGAGVLAGVAGGAFSYWIFRKLWRRIHRGRPS